MLTFSIILLMFIGGLLLLVLLNGLLPIQFCKYMGWHLEPETQGFDGCSFSGKCPRCGKEVLQDSQGNWF